MKEGCQQNHAIREAYWGKKITWCLKRKGESNCPDTMWDLPAAGIVRKTWESKDVKEHFACTLGGRVMSKGVVECVRAHKASFATLQ